MQIFTRRSGESLYIDISESVDPATPVGSLFADGPIEVEVLQSGKQVKLGIDAGPALARALEVGNQVDNEPGSVLGRFVQLPAINRTTVSVVGAVAVVAIAAFAWWAGTGRPPGSYPPAPRQVASREASFSESLTSTPLAEKTVTESSGASASRRELSVPEPLPNVEIAAAQVISEPVAPIRPGEPVRHEPVPQEQATLEEDAIIPAEAPPLPEAVAQHSAEAEQLPDTGLVANADPGGSESDEVAFSALATSSEPGLAPPQPAGASVAEPSELPHAIPATADSTLHREPWLLKRAPHRYTLQLLAGRRESAVLRFVRAQQLDGPVAYYRTQYKGDDWYVLLHGDYPDASSARESLASLPKAVRKGRPYARSMASVQTSIVSAAEVLQGQSDAVY